MSEAKEWEEMESTMREFGSRAKYVKLRREVLAGVKEWRWGNDEFERETPFNRETHFGAFDALVWASVFEEDSRSIDFTATGLPRENDSP